MAIILIYMFGGSFDVPRSLLPLYRSLSFVKLANVPQATERDGDKLGMCVLDDCGKLIYCSGRNMVDDFGSS